jgi:gluconolactonase
VTADARDWSGMTPIRYPDPAIKVLDPRFQPYCLGHTPVQRLYTGALWAEGPCWFGDGRFLVWSDIPNDRMLRWVEETSSVSVFRQPSHHSNGNTRDWQGRLISCEHGTRRVTRTEYDGTLTVLADHYQGKPLNAPNDVVVHPDGGIWFSDPGYGSLMHYEGTRGTLELKEAVYRIDPHTAAIAMMTDALAKPNGLCFSPDYLKLYIVDSGVTHNLDHPREITVWDVSDGQRLQHGQTFALMVIDGLAGMADGIRVDADGNLWAAAGWGGAGFDGVHIFAPTGDRIGQILLPEMCSNVCFGGRKRNRLFMTGSQSLYAVYVETQGAHIA